MLDLFETVWTIDEALKYIREIQPKFHAINYHIALGGSVLNKGKSCKDLDIIVMDQNNKIDSDKVKLALLLVDLGAITNDNNENYKLKGGRRLWKTSQPKYIDWFVYD